MKIVCYGDSNTYGYDPRLGGNGRLAKYERWTGILDGVDGLDIVNEGMCGRCIPASLAEYRSLAGLLERSADADMLMIMLGTNDLFMTREATARKIADRMRAVFANVPALTKLARTPGRRVLLICPPAPSDRVIFYQMVGISMEQTAGEAAKIMSGLPGELRRVAEENGVEFADATAWGITTMFDGLHFSEAGHKKFAGEILAVIEK